jgi:hypothetical protein
MMLDPGHLPSDRYKWIALINTTLGVLMVTELLLDQGGSSGVEIASLHVGSGSDGKNGER